ncbi:MAG: FtsH protease activity modulator HflK [Pseudomonadota bacterium]|nr:FtsH protease activity modulator HflK [Pseudomonadota bacterium]MDE3037601.1 FtsH protease activity modulator HflK [Pseudomonadota bacterium]
MAWGDKNDHMQGPWGRPPSGGNQEGPPPEGPDLDELLKRGQELFRRLFPAGGRQGGGIVAIAAIALLLWLASGTYFVGADEQGVVLRFGAFARTSAPGLNYHLPWPVETVETPRVTAINHVEIGYRSTGGKDSENAVGQESLMLTGDENIIDIDFEVQWKIRNAPDYLFDVRDPDNTVKAVAESSMREVIGKSKIADVLAEGKFQVEQDTKKLIQETLDSYKAGIEVVAVNLLKADPPSEVIDSFRDVQTARADMETARNQAEAYSNDILPRARGDAQKIILDAEAYKRQTVAEAEGEAARFISIYDQYRESRDVTRKRMYIETMQDVLQGMNKMIVDDKNGSGVVPYLPLPPLKPPQPEEDSK